MQRAFVLCYFMFFCLYHGNIMYSQVPPAYDQIYFDNNGTDGIHSIQRYFQSSYNQADDLDLGSVIAGYELGRYALHSLLWYHLAWERSPEYELLPIDDPERIKLLVEARNKIDTMTTVPYFRDVSLCGDVSFKGRTHDGYNRWVDTYSGWGFKRSFDAFVPIPKADLPTGVSSEIKSGEWYKIKIRTENISSNRTTVSVWFTVAGTAFATEPYYQQTYRGRGWQGDPCTIQDIEDAASARVWLKQGTVALLSCF